ncbi:bifunctional precorrin-2 dehydrogenase/sirohydrochlorin ferrochelatase [Methanogenium sp. S4BF]|uniref:precorrin-2 dehydrogenase/sirohydrochlorin ferrochelatase family protein n=1 Tax=Methanogenium sp. S4BF TaxID=1789226 RepID=UPI0024165F29|nr:bifunctional precorrin-2 dehydrogenase/sirohydrochlorin ferrochelatase [Methanogenium sp. S4BF]WFN34935.1 bifunctional precorrin-2 dehydrogenase/sirohydrochlorin ferrochelatase [Methanogenium sp. S4BF]
MIPLMMDLRGAKVVIAGGGAVGARKARYFAHEAHVVVLSRSFHPDFAEIAAETVECDLAEMHDDEIASLLTGSFLVITALERAEMNQRIGFLARRCGAHVNDAGGEGGDVIIPSVVRGDTYCIGISTHGRSPAVARHLRFCIEEHCGNIDGMVRLQEALREDLKQRVPDQRVRSRILNAVLDDPAMWDALSHGAEQAKEQALRKYL